MPQANPTNAAIAANLAVLASILERARTAVCEAETAMTYDHRNLAIGTILELERELPIAVGLLTAILALHRRIPHSGGQP